MIQLLKLHDVTSSNYWYYTEITKIVYTYDI